MFATLLIQSNTSFFQTFAACLHLCRRPVSAVICSLIILTLALHLFSAETTLLYLPCSPIIPRNIDHLYPPMQTYSTHFSALFTSIFFFNLDFYNFSLCVFLLYSCYAQSSTTLSAMYRIIPVLSWDETEKNMDTFIYISFWLPLL